MGDNRWVGGVVAVAIMVAAASSPAWAEHTTSASADVHVVERGDWLWKIAREQLKQRTPEQLSPAGPEPTASEVRAQAEVIYQDNRGTIGPNRNRLRPGQRLRLRPVAMLVPQQPCTPPPGTFCI